MASGLRILVPVKRVIDYAVSVATLSGAQATGDRRTHMIVNWPHRSLLAAQIQESTARLKTNAGLCALELI